MKIGNIFLMGKVEIGNLVQKRRVLLELKQEDVAEMTGITPKTIYLLEQGKGNPSLDTMQKVLDVLGLEMILQIKKLDE